MTDAAAPAAAEQQDFTDLRRAITVPRMALFILGDVLGAGVYVLIGQVAAEVGGAVWAPFLLALCFATFTAFSYAELVTKYPRAGGAAVFVHAPACCCASVWPCTWQPGSRRGERRRRDRGRRQPGLSVLDPRVIPRGSSTQRACDPQRLTGDP